jgi:small subunit ribosomal protein S20
VKKMPNIKSQKKRVLTNNKKNVVNAAFKSSMRSAIKAVETAETKEAAVAALSLATKKVDKAVGRGILHKNNAARTKSRLAKVVAAK